MRPNFSPLAEAARRHATHHGAPPSSVQSAPPMTPLHPAAAVAPWCEWPRRPASNPPFPGIRQALLAIQQARHA